MPPSQTFQNKGLGKEVAPNQSCNPRMPPGQSISKERMISILRTLAFCQVRGASLSVPENLLCVLCGWDRGP